MYTLPIWVPGSDTPGQAYAYWDNFIAYLFNTAPVLAAGKWFIIRDHELQKYNATVESSGPDGRNVINFDTAEDALVFKLKFS